MLTLILTICLLISIAQIIIINHLVKPIYFYLSVLHLFLIYPIIFNQIIPLLLKYVSPNVGQDVGIELLQAYVINFIYIILCIILWRIFTTCYKLKYVRSNSIMPIKTIFIIASLSIAYNAVKLMVYLHIIDVDLNNILFPFNTVFDNLFKVAPFILLYICTRHHDINRMIKVFVYISVVVYFVSIIPTGHRSSLILPMIFSMFYIYNGRALRKIGFFLIFILLFSQVSDLYKSFRYILSPVESISSQEHVSTSFIDEVYFRLSINNEISAGISDMINSSSSPVGLQPLVSSMLSIVPASLFEGGKPWPGSVDGTSFGILSRLAHEYVYQAGWNMSEYMYPLLPVWELGYIYYFINIIFSALIVLVIERLSFIVGDRKLLLPTATMLPFTYSYTFAPLVIIFQQLSYVFIPALILLIYVKFLKYIIKIFFSRKIVLRKSDLSDIK
jgi:hypothetical protein